MYLPSYVIPEVSNLPTMPDLGPWFHDGAAPVLATATGSSSFHSNIGQHFPKQSTTTLDAIFSSTNEPFTAQTTLSVPTITVPVTPSKGTSNDQEKEFVAPLYLQVLGMIWLALLFLALVMITAERIARYRADDRIPRSGGTRPNEQSPLQSSCLCRVPHKPLKPDCPCHGPSEQPFGDDCSCHRAQQRSLQTAGQRSCRPPAGDRHARKHAPILRTAGGPPPWEVCGCDICTIGRRYEHFSMWV